MENYDLNCHYCRDFLGRFKENAPPTKGEINPGILGLCLGVSMFAFIGCFIAVSFLCFVLGYAIDMIWGPFPFIKSTEAAMGVSTVALLSSTMFSIGMFITGYIEETRKHRQKEYFSTWVFLTKNGELHRHLSNPPEFDFPSSVVVKAPVGAGPHQCEIIVGLPSHEKFVMVCSDGLEFSLTRFDCTVSSNHSPRLLLLMIKDMDHLGIILEGTLPYYRKLLAEAELMVAVAGKDDPLRLGKSPLGSVIRKRLGAVIEAAPEAHRSGHRDLDHRVGQLITERHQERERREAEESP